MITGELKNRINSLWEIFWTGGITNPLDVVEQMTYLMFIHDLDETDNLRAWESDMPAYQRDLRGIAGAGGGDPERPGGIGGDGLKVKLSDAFDLQMGKTPSRNNLEYWNGGHKWVAIGDLGNTGKYISHTKECISDEGVAESGIRPVPAGTVIMSFKLSIGKTAITTEEIYTNEAIMAFIDKRVYPIDVNYIYHLFSGMNWSEGSNKAVMGVTLNKATLSQKTINIPDINKQRNVALILDKLDDVISLRKQQLSKLDELVKARFVEMFGDIDKNPYDFPCIYIDEISKEIFAGGDKPADMLPTQTEEYLYPVYANGEMRLGLQGYARYYRVDQPAITISARGTIGFCCVREPFFIPIVRLITLIPKENGNLDYIKNAIEAASLKSSGTSQGQLTVPDFKKTKIIFPPIELQKIFSVFVGHIEESKLTIQQSLDKLEVLKKSLMQEYFERRG